LRTHTIKPAFSTFGNTTSHGVISVSSLSSIRHFSTQPPKPTEAVTEAVSSVDPAALPLHISKALDYLTELAGQGDKSFWIEKSTFSSIVTTYSCSVISY
jgi:hypothetical protein